MVTEKECPRCDTGFMDEFSEAPPTWSFCESQIIINGEWRSLRQYSDKCYLLMCSTCNYTEWHTLRPGFFMVEGCERHFESKDDALDYILEEFRND